LSIGNGGIVVGHTVQDEINSKCNDRLWFSDVGMSKAFGDKQKESDRVQILEINNQPNNKLINKNNIENLQKEPACEYKEQCNVYRIF